MSAIDFAQDTTEQVLEVVKKYLDPDRIVIVAAGDFEKASKQMFSS